MYYLERVDEESALYQDHKEVSSSSASHAMAPKDVPTKMDVTSTVDHPHGKYPLSVYEKIKEIGKTKAAIYVRTTIRMSPSYYKNDQERFDEDDEPLQLLNLPAKVLAQGLATEHQFIKMLMSGLGRKPRS